MKRPLRSVMAFLISALLLLGAAEAVLAEGSTPIAENLELRTYCNVSAGGRLHAYDPDGDPVRYTITTEPVKGTIALEEDGSFVYTPGENKRGRDYFGFRAVDSEGNLSQEATVIIRIEKQKKGVVYWDMAGSADEYAAIALSERGLFTGEQIGGQYSFSPERSVSRGEFLSMCMLLTEQPVSAHVLTTGYTDDEQIPAWMKAYVAAASALGLELGATAEGGARFEPNRPITIDEAEALLDRTLNLENVTYLREDEELTQPCMNLRAYGVVDREAPHGEVLTRLQAARMLSAAMELLDKR